MTSGRRLLVTLLLGGLAFGAWWIARHGPASGSAGGPDEAAPHARASSPDPAIDESALREDVRRLVEGEGSLPPEYVPSGSRFAPVDAPPPADARTPSLGGARLEPVPSTVEVPGGASGLVLSVTSVVPGSRASQAGLGEGDRILQVAGKAPTPAAVVAAQEILRKGGQLRLRVLRRNGDILILELNPGGT